MYKDEEKFFLREVSFHKYRAAVKKYGYKGNLSPQHLRAISDLIKLDIDRMLYDVESESSKILNNEFFTKSEPLSSLFDET